MVVYRCSKGGLDVNELGTIAIVNSGGNVYPERICWDICLGKDNEIGTIASSFLDERCCLLNGLCCV